MRGGFRPGKGGNPLGGMDPRQMDRMMKQLGISNEDVPDVEEVLVRTKTKEYVIRPAEVSVMVAQGQKTWQVTGTVVERPRGGETATKPAPAASAYAEEDVRLVMEQANVSRDKALAALKAAGGEPAAAIVALLEGT